MFDLPRDDTKNNNASFEFRNSAASRNHYAFHLNVMASICLQKENCTKRKTNIFFFVSYDSISSIQTPSLASPMKQVFPCQS